MMQREFESVFARLRGILEKHSKALTVSADAPGYYCLGVQFSAKLGKGYPVAWVKTGKRYVSYHYMPVYMFPKLRNGLSKRLRSRMQGKSCFNFTAIDESLFEELEQLTAKGLVVSRDAGFGPARN